MKILIDYENQQITFQDTITVEELLDKIMELKKNEVITEGWEVCPLLTYTYSGGYGYTPCTCGTHTGSCTCNPPISTTTNGYVWVKEKCGSLQD